jgi:hypothetical protein
MANSQVVYRNVDLATRVTEETNKVKCHYLTCLMCFNADLTGYTDDSWSFL